MQDGRELPGQVDGISDAGVHALPADGAVDVRGVAEEEGATLLEVVRDAVVHMVRREPVHVIDLDAEPLDRSLADVVPGEPPGCVSASARTVPIRRARPAPCIGKSGEKVGFVEAT